MKTLIILIALFILFLMSYSAAHGQRPEQNI